MARMFRLLRADEIECRVGQTKAGKGLSLLLYKDARCDQNILDETVGPMNWMRQHERENANCIVSIYDKEKCQWISKEDTGTESKTEAEKGLASDSFKRACVNWGIGRELYSAPHIWISGDPDKLKWEKFTVAEIGYDAREEINALAIADKNGCIVYRYGNTTAEYQKPMNVETPPDAMDEAPIPPPVSWTPMIALSTWCHNNGLKMADFGNLRAALIASGIVPDIKSSDMTPEQVDTLCHAIEANYPDQLRKSA